MELAPFECFDAWRRELAGQEGTDTSRNEDGTRQESGSLVGTGFLAAIFARRECAQELVEMKRGGQRRKLLQQALG